MRRYQRSWSRKQKNIALSKNRCVWKIFHHERLFRLAKIHLPKLIFAKMSYHESTAHVLFCKIEVCVFIEKCGIFYVYFIGLQMERANSVSCPPRSPNLKPIQNFLLEFSKARVYIQQPPLPPHHWELRNRISTAAPGTLRVCFCWEVCCVTGGGHVEIT
jgi:hypothetical protein